MRMRNSTLIASVLADKYCSIHHGWQEPWRTFQVETKSNFPSMNTPFLQTEIDLQENMALKEL